MGSPRPAASCSTATRSSSARATIESTGRYLFAAQTFVPATVARIDTTNPSNVVSYATGDPHDVAAGLDGMTIDAQDRLFVAANNAGTVWRIGTDREACQLAEGIGNPSAVAFGGGGPFPAENLYVVGFGGAVTEIPGARTAPPAAPAATTVTVRPRSFRAKRRTRVTARIAPARAGVTVRIGKHFATTDATGRVRFRLKVRRAGRLTVRAGGARAALRVRPAARAPRTRARSG